MNAFRRFTIRRRKDDLRQELEAHLRMAIVDRVARGESPDSARQAALREFGNVPLIEDATHDTWAWTRLERLAQDLRYTLRQFRRSPAFATTVIGTLALGIAAPTAMFTVVNHLLIQPTPYPNPSRLLLISKNNGKQVFGLSPTWSDIQQWKQQSHSFRCLTFWSTMEGHNYLESKTASLEVLGMRVSPNLLRTLGVQPLIGRDFARQSSKAGNDFRPLILSHTLWQQSFGGSKSILGKTVRINDLPYTVIGVMPPGFRFPLGPQTMPQVWTPILRATDNLVPSRGASSWGSMSYSVIARLRRGLRLQSATAEMNVIQKRVASQYRNPQARSAQSTVRLQRYSSSLVNAGTRKALLALLAASGVLWLIAIVNAANLFLARMTARRREIATRGALGASRARVVQQLVVEGLLLSAAAGAVGALIAFASLRVLTHELHNHLPLPVPPAPDLQVLAALLTLTLLSAALSTGLPAFFASRTSIEPALRQGGLQTGTGRRDHRTRSALIAVEVALSLALLVCCGLLLRTIYALRSVPLGFRTDHVIVATLSVPSYQFAGRNMTTDLYEPLLNRTRRLPGIQTAALMTDVPLSRNFLMTFTMPGDTNGWGSYLKAITPGIRQVFGIHLVAGRYFDAHDTPSSQPVAVVNQTFARMHSPDPHNPNAILGTGLLDFRKDAPARVVGIFADEHQSNVYVPAVPEVDVCLCQLNPRTNYYEFIEGVSMDLALRTTRPTAQIIPELRDILGHASPELRNATITTMDQIVEDSYGNQRLAAHLLEIFGGSALLLCMAGLYGLLAYVVSQRTREMGLRIALGARRGNLLWLILRQAGILLLLGTAAGAVLAFASTRLLRSFLYGVHPHDAWTFAAAALLLLASGLLAAYLPARRAAHTDPMEALRAE